MENKRVSILLFVIFVLCIVSVGGFLIMRYRIDSLQEDVSQKARIIKTYEKMTRQKDNLVVSDSRGRKIRVDSIVKENETFLHDIAGYKQKLELIKVNYGIEVIEDGNTMYVKGDRVDSALMLLDVFRDAIHYDKKKRSYYVERIEYR